MKALALAAILASSAALADPPAMQRVGDVWHLSDEGLARIQARFDEQERELARVRAERDTLAELSQAPRMSVEAVVVLVVLGALAGGGAVYSLSR